MPSEIDLTIVDWDERQYGANMEARFDSYGVGYLADAEPEVRRLVQVGYDSDQGYAAPMEDGRIVTTP